MEFEDWNKLTMAVFGVMMLVTLFTNPLKAVTYVAMIIAILVVHEGAHYLTTRYFGTFDGFVFKPMKGLIGVKSRPTCTVKEFMLIAAAGPIATFVFLLIIRYGFFNSLFMGVVTGLFDLMQIGSAVLFARKGWMKYNDPVTRWQQLFEWYVGKIRNGRLRNALMPHG